MIQINNQNDILNFLQSQGIINLDDVQENMKEYERQQILKKHKSKISYSEKEGRWKTHIPDSTKKDGRRQIAKTNKEDLENFLIEFYSGLEDDAYTKRVFFNIEQIYPKWLKHKNSQTNASSYARRIMVDWNKYYKGTDIVRCPLHDLTYLKLHEWAYSIIKKYQLTKKQYYNMAMIMRQCLDYACEPEIGLLQENPFRRVKIKGNLFIKKEKPKSNTQVFITNEQEKLVNEAYKKFQDRPWCTSPLMIVLNFQLGLRIGELCAIRWSDIDGNYIHIQNMETEEFFLDDNGNTLFVGYKVVPYTKSSAGDRFVYLNQTARKILSIIKKTNLQHGYYDDGFIYIGSQSKCRGTSRALSQYLTDLCVFSGVMAKSNHKIRKTYISSLFDKGININTIREQAGHEDEKTSLNNYCFDQNTDTVIESKLESARNDIMCI